MSITALPSPPSTNDPANFATRADALLAALPAFVEEANATAVAMNLNSTTDASASSVVIGTGAKSFAVSTGKSFQPGMYLVIADTAAPSTNSMFGQITSYDISTGALVMNILYSTGGGTKAAWTLSQSSAGIGASPRAARIDVASVAGTVDLTANAPNTDDIRITGTLAITAFTVAVGRVIRVTAGGNFTIASNANIDTKTSAALTFVVGDSFVLRATAANVVEVISISRVALRVLIDVAASRTSGVGYAATEDRHLLITAANNTAGVQIQLVVDGLSVQQPSVPFAGGYVGISAPVLRGSTYQLSATGGSNSILDWKEYYL